MKITKVLLIFLLWPTFSAAESIEKINFDKSISKGEQEMKLKGLGLRKVYKFGFPVKVYVAGLYVEDTAFDANTLLTNDSSKLLKMVFLRVVDKKDLVKSFRTGLIANCLKEHCAEAKSRLSDFNKLMVDTKKNGTLVLHFLPSAVEVKMDGRSQTQGKVEGEAFSRSLLAVFIGDKPPTEEFKQGLLGEAKD